MTAPLRVIAERSGNQLGTIERVEDGSIATEGLGASIFEQIRDGKGWNDQQTFEALADGGYSNGYVTVRA